MALPLQLLLVEDRSADAERTLRQLEAEGYAPTGPRVASEAEFVAQLRPGLDLVLSGYSVAGLPGPRALELYRQSGVDVPFIFVSATIGEEAALEAIREGAADYVHKDRLARLGPAVRRALELRRWRIEHRQAEVRLQEQASLLDLAQDGIAVTDLDSRIQYWNKGCERILGWTADEVLGRRADEIARVEPAVAESVRIQLSDLGQWSGEFEVVAKDGRRVTLYSRSTLLPGGAGIPHAVLAISTDITARKQTEDALRERTAFFEAQVESSLDGILVLNERGERLLQNRRLQEMFGEPPAADGAADPEALAHIVRQAKHRARIGERVRTLAADPDATGREEFELTDGRLVDCSWAPVRDPAGKYYGRIWTFRDRTEHRRLEQQFLRAQRLEAIGTLSSGIAHDLNNILAPMLMAAGLLRDQLTDPHHRELLAMVESGAQRGANIIRQLLTFSRGIEGERVPLQLRHLIKEMAGIARETFPRNITVVADAAGNLRPILADATQLHQVLMNLCVNARDAMPQGGTLTLHAENVALEANRLPPHADARPGAHVLLSVTDTGEGIPPEIIERIFDPFFTTKGLGKGTGLGLSTVLGIIKSHEGFILVQSAPGAGASFRIYLPAAPGGADPAAHSGTVPAFRGAGEGVLVVDDEDAVRRATCLALERSGFRTLPAASGEAGLEVFAAHRAEIRVALVDLMMPAMGGAALIRALREANPALKIVAVTGLEVGEHRPESSELGVAETLMKPFTPRQLIETVVAVLRG